MKNMRSTIFEPPKFDHLPKIQEYNNGAIFNAISWIIFKKIIVIITIQEDNCNNIQEDNCIIKSRDSIITGSWTVERPQHPNQLCFGSVFQHWKKLRTKWANREIHWILKRMLFTNFGWAIQLLQHIGAAELDITDLFVTDRTTAIDSSSHNLTVDLSEMQKNKCTLNIEKNAFHKFRMSHLITFIISVRRSRTPPIFFNRRRITAIDFSSQNSAVDSSDAIEKNFLNRITGNHTMWSEWITRNKMLNTGIIYNKYSEEWRRINQFQI